MKFARIFWFTILLIGICFNAYSAPPSNIDNSKTYNTYITNNNIKNQHKVEFIARISDTRKTTTELYSSYDFNNEVYGAGVRFIFKIGKSYEEKLIEELREELK